MSISTKTRKTLWAKSGNRCAMCHTELVCYRNGNYGDVIIGEECHIVSSRTKGPRHDPNIKIGFDDYDNLILLCGIHHKIIDEQVDVYTAPMLLLIKSQHEVQIKKILDEIANSPKENADIVNRITSGKQLVEIIDSVHGYSFDNEDVNTKEEADVIAAFFENMEDYGDVMSMDTFEKSRQVRLGLQFNEELHALDRVGFWVFGERRKRKITYEGTTKTDIWDVAVLHVVRNSSPNIIRR